ncbi:MAG: chemotaxis protein CheW, partial [Myxococcota bacterium]
GIEPPGERRAKGKPATGNIRLTARNENESVVITIEDDGRGIDPNMLRDKAVRKGLHTPEEVEAMSDEEARMLIFAAGFSTKEQATDLSGRGVGMDVVRTHIEKAGGRISLDSEVGTGTTFTLWLPLSMAVSHVMTVTVDSQLYGIGMDSVVETVRCPAKSLRNIKGREAFVLREELVPVLRLRGLLGLSSSRVLNTYDEEAVLVLRVGGESLGLVVDEFGENIEVLVRPLEGWIGNMKEYSGSAVLGDGRLLLVVDMKELMRNVH